MDRSITKKATQIFPEAVFIKLRNYGNIPKTPTSMLNTEVKGFCWFHCKHNSLYQPIQGISGWGLNSNTYQMIANYANVYANWLCYGSSLKIQIVPLYFRWDRFTEYANDSDTVTNPPYINFRIAVFPYSVQQLDNGAIEATYSPLSTTSYNGSNWDLIKTIPFCKFKEFTGPDLTNSKWQLKHFVGVRKMEAIRKQDFIDDLYGGTFGSALPNADPAYITKWHVYIEWNLAGAIEGATDTQPYPFTFDYKLTNYCRFYTRKARNAIGKLEEHKKIIEQRKADFLNGKMEDVDITTSSQDSNINKKRKLMKK